MPALQFAVALRIVRAGEDVAGLPEPCEFLEFPLATNSGPLSLMIRGRAAGWLAQFHATPLRVLALHCAYNLIASSTA